MDWESTADSKVDLSSLCSLSERGDIGGVLLLFDDSGVLFSSSFVIWIKKKSK